MILSRRVTILFLFVFISLFIVFCNDSSEKKIAVEAPQSKYLNHSDTAKYVGINTCKLCHQDIYNTFIKTGMGQSFDFATKQKSAAKFENTSLVYDKYSNFSYHPYWDVDSLKIKEFRLEGKDTVCTRTEKVDYVIGSGQHTNSHIFNTNGYLHQMPMTFYTQTRLPDGQEGKWDLPPGFENGFNTRFSRKIGLECMSCHNALPDFVMGSENKYESVPNGINCERCHGPGSIHVQQKSEGIRVDTSKEIDYSIVNPAKLPIDLQFDVCQRCHLQGNTVLKEDKSFYDFRPGMKLSDFMTVFLPKYKNADDEFIMASHADRLKQSQCFIKSFKPAENKDELRPYKSALTCVTCHNPHVSVKVTGKEIFNNACKNCHGGKENIVCTEKQEVRMKVQDNCVSCHMPKSGSIDIPHVRVTDHYIRKPMKKEEVEKIKQFIGLKAINEKNTDAKTMARAYLNQYEKFETNDSYLDSAYKYIKATGKSDFDNVEDLVQMYFAKQNYNAITQLVNGFDKQELITKKLYKKSYTNQNAWTCYRIGESYQSLGMTNDAYLFFNQANTLAPFVLDFKNKYGGVLLELKKIEDAKAIFEEIIKEDKKYSPAYCNLGYVYILQGDDKNAELNYNKALALNPDYEQAWMNKAGLYLFRKDPKQAKQLLLIIQKKFPNNQTAKALLKELQNYL